MRTIQPDEFARRISSSIQDQNNPAKFALFLGAGCSRSSGIPTSDSLIRDVWIPRLHQLQGPKGTGPTEWAEQVYGITQETIPPGIYGQLMLDLFPTPAERQHEVEELSRRAKPGHGYATLAQIISKAGDGLNFVLTTNFDDLIVDSLYLFADERPRVISHGSLSQFVQPTWKRPIVVKLHGHHQFTPLNTIEETQEIDEELAGCAASILGDRGIIFMGYSGRDAGIKTLLENLPSDSLRYGVYWLSRNQPENELSGWLEQKDFIWVPEGDFDQTMVRLRVEFDLPLPDSSRLVSIYEGIKSDYKEISKQISPEGIDSQQSSSLREAAARIDEDLEDWAIYEIRAQRLKQTDPEAAVREYELGLEVLPDSVPLKGNYANLLKDLGRFDEAKAQYEVAIQAQPDCPNVLHDYAIFLWRTIGDVEKARHFILKAMANESGNPVRISNYANFYWEVARDNDRAFDLYKQAVSTSTNLPEPYRQFANFAFIELRDFGLANDLYFHAQTLRPYDVATLVSRANLSIYLGDNETAYQLLVRAKAASDGDTQVLGALANYFWQQSRQLDKAEVHFESAIARQTRSFAEEQYLRILKSRYAIFLSKERENVDRADELLREIVEEDPSNSEFVALRATFVAIDLANPEEALAQLDEFESRSEVTPPTIGARAIVLEIGFHDYVDAECLYRQATKLEKLLPNAQANLAGLLFARGEIEEGTKRCLLALNQVGFESPSIAVECGFHMYAHSPEPEQGGWLAFTKHLVNSGARSKGWDLSKSAEKAIENEHLADNWLRTLSEVIVCRESEQTLDEWEEWRQAEEPVRVPIGE